MRPEELRYTEDVADMMKETCRQRTQHANTGKVEVKPIAQPPYSQEGSQRHHLIRAALRLALKEPLTRPPSSAAQVTFYSRHNSENTTATSLRE